MVDVCIVVFFFFKQKTAYEMRISDWSSDVCSSDLACLPIRFRDCLTFSSAMRGPRVFQSVKSYGAAARRSGRLRRARSEEHTSELQSLMRISYAVFCLKKKKTT